MSLYAKSSQISPTASTYLGCFTDANARTLVTPSNPSSSTFMTPAACQASCTSSGFLYSGVEAGSECWCGSSLSNTATHDASGQLCSVACTGSSTTNCGGNWAIAVYGRTLIPTSTSWTSIGCYLDDGTVRTLAGPVSKDNSLTPAKCQAACVGYAYSGVEFGSTCYCSNTMARTIQRPTAECSTPCAGDSTQMCGGAYRMTMSKVSTA
ncbi:hypothetical protein FRB96_009301 [Tulasnella sp. 330]|nr:hypothetical protein FRB96_009301 [Tulasnella sp. 330]KAG8887089.1 hypothetical protein FRB98_000559 [Tulasnella sp. 332]